MREIMCATGNIEKFNLGKHILATFDIHLERVDVKIDEIQGEDPDYIIRDKAQKAYESLGEPVAVTDDSWNIPALSGFPGPYMKSMNHWFEPGDFINLMRGKSNRTIFINQRVAYHDGQDVHIFHNDIPGEITPEPRGSYGPPIMHVAAMNGDKGLTISEAYDQGLAHVEARLASPNDAWRQLGNWLTKT